MTMLNILKEYNDKYSNGYNVNFMEPSIMNLVIEVIDGAMKILFIN